MNPEPGTKEWYDFIRATISQTEQFMERARKRGDFELVDDLGRYLTDCKDAIEPEPKC